MYVPGDSIVDVRQDYGQIFYQVRSIPSLLQLFNHGNHNIIIDAVCVDLVVC